MIFELVFIAVLSFLKTSGYTEIECISLNNKPYPARPKRIYLNPNELRYYTFMDNSGRSNENCNHLDD